MLIDNKHRKKKKTLFNSSKLSLLLQSPHPLEFKNSQFSISNFKKIASFVFTTIPL
jgi:hypothetical protein